MRIPKLKRVKVSTVQQLATWGAKHATPTQQVMIVTCNATSRDKHLSRDQVSGVLGPHGWDIGRSYTLDGTLVGHIARPRQ